MKKVLMSIAALLLLVGSFLALSYLDFSDKEGTITIILIDEIGDTISSREYDFTSDDTLFDLLEENYDIGCADSSYQLSSECSENILTSRVILKIDGIETDWDNSYIAIYENDKYSILGIDEIALNDGDIFIFEYKVYGGDN
jgi:hypothetical protein